jgi:hypothetical protein
MQINRQTTKAHRKMSLRCAYFYSILSSLCQNSPVFTSTQLMCPS